ncbi:MAG: polysaccharide deacetylase family protein [Sphingomonadales bacterium]|nr:polysaccharide deacetylase family protein [Sphingomonadales bacterium]
MKSSRLLLAALVVCATPAAARPSAGRIALTFDDLPALTIIPDQAYVNDLSRRLLAELRRHHVPAIGFVNESKLDDLDRAQQIGVLRAWLNAGMELGNHTFSHDAPEELGARGYVEDIARGEAVTRPLMAEHGKREQWFRHPYLKTGYPVAVRDAIDAWLTAHGYRIAPVTMDADDWEFAEPYDYAIAHHDAAGAAHIKAEYLSHTEDMIHWYRAAAQVLFHRDIAYVMLLHATRLNADSFGDLFAMLKRNRLKPVPLAEAMRDPAYRTPDGYMGKEGVDWMERWALALHRHLPREDKNDPPRDIQQAYDKVDDDRCSGGSECSNSPAPPAPAGKG